MIFLKTDGTLFVSHEDIDSVGYVGSWEDWFQYLLDPYGPGLNWYQEYVQEFEGQDFSEHESLMTFTDWIENTLHETLQEANDEEIKTLPQLTS